MKKVSIIISNKNTGDLLKAGLSNIKEIKDKYYEDIEVIVVDNSSTDGSVEMLAKQFPWVHVIETEDHGLSAANNLGTKRAAGDYYLFLTPDAYPRNKTIGNMVKYMENHQKVGLATPKLYLKSGKVDRDAHRGFPTPWNSFTRLTGLYKLFPKSELFNSYFMQYEDLSKEHEIDVCVFGFMMYPKKVFDDIGGFDQDYFAFGEDVDICYRLKEKGFKVMYLPQWESGHFKTNLPGEPDRVRDASAKSLGEKLKLARHSTNSMRIFVSKHYKDKYSLPLVWFMKIGTYLLELQRLLKVLILYPFSK